MTIGPILLLLGVAQILWMVWSIRTYDPQRASIARRVLDDIARTKTKPKSRLEMTIERYSSWLGLIVGFLMIGLGLIFMFPE